MAIGKILFQIILTERIFSRTCLRLLMPLTIFALFFMVLDLRLMKIGCRDDNQFFFLYGNTGLFRTSRKQCRTCTGDGLRACTEWNCNRSLPILTFLTFAHFWSGVHGWCFSLNAGTEITTSHVGKSRWLVVFPVIGTVFPKCSLPDTKKGRFSPPSVLP